MDRIVGQAPVPEHLRGGVIALGNFDGFHRGHQAVAARALELARERGVPALIGTFDPHPARHFKPDLTPMTLTTLAQKLELFSGFGFEAAVIWNFDDHLADMSAASFTATELASRLGVGGVVTGWDFVFGRGRGGDTQVLRELGRAHGFTAETVAPVGGEEPVSSTSVRAALREGRPEAAAALMGRPFTIRGEVIHGNKLGRTLGFPTANLRLGGYVRPAYGVYAVRVTLPGGEVRGGVANLGVRPMFVPPVELLETFVFDWAGDLYGREIDVALIAYLRPEWKLDGLSALAAQVERDKAAARAALGTI
ncbi:MAG: bifunctional riboflavin kinase/FAD synthetase [Sphingomonadaceae bacterium]|nr:bifunctional riboflavin kinase/FAD synthetase [Sphingomonadaceae bacterium]